MQISPETDFWCNMIEQPFFRNKYNAEQALNDFAVITRNEVNLELLAGELLKVVETILRPEKQI